MDKQTLEYIVKKTKELIAAPSCCAEAKQAAQAWLDAVGTEHQAEQTKRYIAELEEDIGTVDGLLAFAESEAGRRHFGDEAAKNMAEHARELKANGATYCDCPACNAVAAILEKKQEIFA